MSEPEPDYGQDHGPDDEGYLPDEAFTADAPCPQDEPEL